MKTTPVLSGMFCWHELITARTGDAAKFYQGLLGGELKTFPTPSGDYNMLELDGQVLGGFQTGNSEHPMDAPSQWLSYVAVDDVDATCALAVKCGGTVITPPHEMPVGRSAIIRDAQGARVALFKSAPGKTDGTNPDGDGAVCWMELVTTDVPAAAAFYAKVLGWSMSIKKMPWGDMQVASVGAVPVATLFARCADDKISYCRWYPYFQVESVDNVLKRTGSLGGKAASDPMEVPNVGRWLPVTDAVGAEVAFLEPIKK